MGRKALSWANLQIERSAYIPRCCRKVVLWELVVQRREGCRHGSLSSCRTEHVRPVPADETPDDNSSDVKSSNEDLSDEIETP
jgi:hypothetical protein